jgi:hypothetical protein
MILPDNLDRCNKITHAGDKNEQKIRSEGWNYPAGDRRSPELIFNRLVSAGGSKFHAGFAARPRMKEWRLFMR